jgi:hypothetical protein
MKILAKKSLGYYELEFHKQWYGKGSEKLLDWSE